jgi:capsular polysaccharide biosynthesis protein/transposase-like protein
MRNSMSSETQAGGGQGRPAALPSGDRDKALALLRSGRSVVSVSKELELPEEAVRKLARGMKSPGATAGTSGNGGGTNPAPAPVRADNLKSSSATNLGSTAAGRSPSPRPPLQPRDRDTAAALLRKGSTVAEVSQELGASEESIRKLERTLKRPADSSGAAAPVTTPPVTTAAARTTQPSARPASESRPAAESRPATESRPAPAPKAEPARPAPASRPAPAVAAAGTATTATAVVDDEPAPGPYHEIGRKVTRWGRLELKSRPYVSPGRSARNHWKLITVITIALMLIGAEIAILKPPTYTAQARLIVGKTVDLGNIAAIPGLAAAGQELASDYSRLVGTQIVDGPAQKSLGAGGFRGATLSASPIAQSPVVLVEASASSPELAIAVANAGSKALVGAVNSINSKQLASADSILEEYGKAVTVLNQDQAQVDNLKLAGADSNNANPTLKNQYALALVAVSKDNLKVQALSTDYQGVVTPSDLNEQVITQVSSAHSTGNNRKKTLEIALLGSLVAGVLLGTAIATWLDRRGTTRA